MKNIFKKVSIILVALLALGTMSYASTPLAINGQGVDSSLQTQNNLQPSSSSSITRTTTQPTTQSGIVEQPAGQTSGSTTILSENKAKEDEKEKADNLPHAGASLTAFYAIAVLSVVAGVMYTKSRN